MDELKRRPDVLIVGAGIVAAAVALRLARDGNHLTLVAPRSHPGHATNASGAMLGVLGEVSPEDDERRSRIEFDLRLRARHLYEGWLDEICAYAPAPELRHGTFVVASPRRPTDVQALNGIEVAARGHGLRCERVDAADVPGLWPAATHAPPLVLHLPDEGWVEAPALLEATLEAAAATGNVAILEDRVSAVTERDGSVSGVATERHGDVAAPAVVLCAGSEVGDILSASGLSELVPAVLRAKGVSLRLERSSRPSRGSPLTHAVRTPNREFACGLHVLPRGQGVYLGATNRLSRYEGMTGEVTGGEIVALVRGASRDLVADLATWNVAGLAFGNRPLSSDRLPIVGATGLDGLFVATGTYRNGVLLAPLMAEILAAELAGDRPEPLLVPGPERWSVPSPNPRDVLSAGLRQFAQLLRDPDDPPLAPQPEALAAALGALALASSEDDAKARDYVHRVLRAHPLIELVPELLIEMSDPALMEWAPGATRGARP